MPQLVASYSTAWYKVGNADVQIRYCCWVEAVFKSVCSCFDCPIPSA